ncbi:MAG TPA: DNA adenine methylase [Candidatus Methanomethylophilaceae archaeon]|nr:DNA adenine methylase [Candidatus Methanomethylophilaceae archaeon]
MRYPGGKGRLSGYFKSLLPTNGLEGGTYIEPFAGGAGIAVTLLAEGNVSKIVLNDADRSIYALWHVIKYRGEELIEAIEEIDVNIEEWTKQRDIQRNKKNEDLFDLGLSTFFMNRTNRSGILNGGVIGGQGQEGKYKIDARFNKKNLTSRIAALSELSDNVEVHCMDANDFLAEELDRYDTDTTLVYIDPPYYEKGSTLYMNHFEHEDHVTLSDIIRNLKHKWILSYDNTPEIREIYSDMEPVCFDLQYSSYKSRIGKEVFYCSDSVQLPNTESTLPTPMHNTHICNTRTDCVE